MGIDGSRYKYKGFCEKFTFPKSINRGAHESLVGNTPLSSLPLVVTSVLEDIQLSNNHVDTTRSQTLEWLEELIQMIQV